MSEPQPLPTSSSSPPTSLSPVREASPRKDPNTSTSAVNPSNKRPMQTYSIDTAALDAYLRSTRNQHQHQPLNPHDIQHQSVPRHVLLHPPTSSTISPSNSLGLITTPPHISVANDHLILAPAPRRHYDTGLGLGLRPCAALHDDDDPSIPFNPYTDHLRTSRPRSFTSPSVLLAPLAAAATRSPAHNDHDDSHGDTNSLTITRPFTPSSTAGDHGHGHANRSNSVPNIFTPSLIGPATATRNDLLTSHTHGGNRCEVSDHQHLDDPMNKSLLGAERFLERAHLDDTCHLDPNSIPTTNECEFTLVTLPFHVLFFFLLPFLLPPSLPIPQLLFTRHVLFGSFECSCPTLVFRTGGSTDRGRERENTKGSAWIDQRRALGILQSSSQNFHPFILPPLGSSLVSHYKS
ncbi:uncharacterized protein EI90DRAFT_442717 [Cantharellus anzutake]|uniref:uncharacterized protein n=1 Tax=Cantharellus anzutake TaxID=1750568 RepID=UPI001906A720|nr:uncharacterized protein EI90DRAFT_442717 [Cantharellus anzutake]KAF8334607.1 hypothetical protein EI90DRAFT_442717 [Cantharellus anzutake]